MRVYRIDGQESSWERLGQAINGDNAYDDFGWCVNLSPDGNTIAIGFPEIGGYDGYGGGQGYVRVFSLEVGDDDVDTGSWKQIDQDIIGEANGDEFGYSGTFSDDGKTLAVSAISNDPL